MKEVHFEGQIFFSEKGANVYLNQCAGEIITVLKLVYGRKGFPGERDKHSYGDLVK